MRRIRKPCWRFRSGTPVRGSGGSRRCPLSTPKASKPRSRTRRPDDVRHAEANPMAETAATGEVIVALTPRSSDPPQALGVLLPAMDVDVGTGRDHAAGGLVERARGARRRADDQGIVRERLAF